jgi:diadenosine tetraphosphate (Ap4A) HIT family hydrolase
MIETERECAFCSLPPERILIHDPLTLVIRDGFPISPGHTLVIPKRHVVSFFELTFDERNRVCELLMEAKLNLGLCSAWLLTG